MAFASLADQAACPVNARQLPAEREVGRTHTHTQRRREPLADRALADATIAHRCAPSYASLPALLLAAARQPLALHPSQSAAAAAGAAEAACEGSKWSRFCCGSLGARTVGHERLGERAVWPRLAHDSTQRPLVPRPAARRCWAARVVRRPAVATQSINHSSHQNAPSSQSSSTAALPSKRLDTATSSRSAAQAASSSSRSRSRSRSSGGRRRC